MAESMQNEQDTLAVARISIEDRRIEYFDEIPKVNDIRGVFRA